MPELLSITTYPLTGARGNEMGRAEVGPAGLEGDRAWLCYEIDPSDYKGEASVYNRIGLSGCRVLTTLNAELQTDGALALVTGDETARLTIEDPLRKVDPERMFVNEFGTETPCYYAGDGASLAVSGLLQGRRLRLGRKVPEWLDGGIIPPAERRVAPVHIVNQASVRSLAGSAMAQESGMLFDERRFRPNLCVDGFAPFTEQGWIGKIVAIGDAHFQVVAPTPRCGVTGMDPLSGKQLKDMPRLLREHEEVGPSDRSQLGNFGVYAYPLVKRYADRPIIIQGDEVKVIEG